MPPGNNKTCAEVSGDGDALVDILILLETIPVAPLTLVFLINIFIDFPAVIVFAGISTDQAITSVFILFVCRFVFW